MTESSAIERLNIALVGRYRIERELGAGGMATVYLADDLKHDRRVAIKVLRQDLAASLGAERFHREIRIAAALQHPHILPLYDSGDADGLLFYVMPYVAGISLRQKLLKEGELPIAEAVRILRDVADALSAAHEHGVVHRDLKPENVMLSGRHALVTDFGVAKAVSEATGQTAITTMGVALGTPAYMSPEQATADPHADYRSDIYSFGVLAYELLTGGTPFTGHTPQAILSAHVTTAAEPVTHHRASIPPALAFLVMKCLEKKPADRWQRADELIPQLEAVLTPSGGVTPHETAPIVSLAAPSGRRPVRMMVGGFVAALVLVALGYGVMSGRFGGAGRAGHLPTLAVLPFENLGAADDEYFADGMTEELTSRLAKVSGLAVIARTSANQYKKTTKAIAQIAQELGADFLIEGTVRWEKLPGGARRVRITPQLVRAKDGTHVWAEQYEKPYGTEIFAMQSDIAEQVASALSVTLLTGERKAVRAAPTNNLKAYDYFLRGQAYTARVDASGDFVLEGKALES